MGFLGSGGHTLASVELTVVADASHDLVQPRDLAFDPDAPEHLWVVDRHDDAMVVLTNPGTSGMAHWRSAGLERSHWLAKPSAIAFGSPGYVATAHDSDGDPQGAQDPSMAMGPTLWPSSLSDFDGGRPSHLDMVHDPALMQGIAWERDLVYWIHDGWNRCLTRMDFVEPHEPGGTYHGDATVDRFVCGAVGYLEDVPAHMEWDADQALLWFADPDRGTVSTLDVSGATPEQTIDGADEALRQEWSGATLTAVLAGDPLVQPSGLALYGDLILVSDVSTGFLLAFRRDGTLADWLDTELGAGALAGITVGPDGALWVVDRASARVLRFAAL